jgi:primary-amine oxidase
MHISGSIYLSLLGLALSSAVPPLGYERRLLREAFDKRTDNASSTSCFAAGAPSTVAPKPNVWAPLSPEDNLAVWNFLHDPAAGLNLTHPNEAVLTDNYLYCTPGTLKCIR